MAENAGTFAKLLEFLRSQRPVVVPSTLTFLQVDVPVEASSLRLVERAAHDAPPNRPTSDALELGDCETEIAARMQQLHAQSFDTRYACRRELLARSEAIDPTEIWNFGDGGTRLSLLLMAVPKRGEPLSSAY